MSMTNFTAADMPGNKKSAPKAKAEDKTDETAKVETEAPKTAPKKTVSRGAAKAKEAKAETDKNDPTTTKE